MPELEKVIKGLECCILRDPDDHARCSQCSYGGNCVNRLKMDALELLKAQDISETNVAGWISVKDRMPESSGLKVIVSAKTTSESVLQTKAVFVAFLGYGDGKWYTPDVDFMASAKTGNDNVHPVWEITHWMFPPEPPKEES